MNATNRNRIARLNPDGSLDNSFKPSTGANQDVLSIALQTDGKVLIGGLFSTFNGTNRNHLARLNDDGSLDGTFNPPTGSSSGVDVIEVQTDGKVLVGGIHTTVNGTNLDNILRLDSDGSLDTTFNPGIADGSVFSVVVQSDGKILVGGLFATINGVSWNHIARLNVDGSFDSSFSPSAGANDGVYSLAVQPDGNVLVGGAFTILNGTARWRIGRLLGDLTLLNIERVDNQAVLTWINQGYTLQTAPSATGTFTNILGAISPYTNPISRTQQYFRLNPN